MTSEGASNRAERLIELCSAILLSLATVGSAWCAYQSTLWGGIETFRLAEATKLGREAAESSLKAGQFRLIDVQIFIEFMKATLHGDERLAAFYRDRFRKETRPALEAWLATNPLENRDAPPSPFAMPEYSLSLDREAEQFEKRSASLYEEARSANQASDRFLLFTVLFASVLFFGGIEMKFKSVRIRAFLIGLAGVVFLVAAAAMTTLPLANE